MRNRREPPLAQHGDICAALPWSAPYPTIGTEVRIWAMIGVCCSSTGRLSGTAISSWTVAWCEPPAPAQTRFSNGMV